MSSEHALRILWFIRESEKYFLQFESRMDVAFFPTSSIDETTQFFSIRIIRLTSTRPSDISVKVKRRYNVIAGDSNPESLVSVTVFLRHTQLGALRSKMKKEGEFELRIANPEGLIGGTLFLAYVSTLLLLKASFLRGSWRWCRTRER